MANRPYGTTALASLLCAALAVMAGCATAGAQIPAKGTDAFERGLTKVDFLGEPSRWKSEWATAEREHVNIHMRPSSVSGAMKHLRDTRVKPVAKKILRKG